MKTPVQMLRAAVVVAAVFGWMACSSGKEVTRSDARVGGPQAVAATDAANSDKAKDPNAPQPKSRMPEINTRAKMLFEDATKAFDAQKKSRKFDYPALTRKFKAALDADGQLAEAAYNMGVIAEREGKKDQAIAYYKDALRRKPTLKAAAENLAVMAQNSGDTQTAAGIYQDILKAYPDDASSRARLAELYRASGDADRALEFAREALIRDPKTVPAYKVMIRAYLDRQQLQLAKLVALRAVKLDESDPELYYTTGLILQQENDFTKARIQFKRALEVRPDYQPAHVVLSKLALKDGNFAGAEQHLRQILQADGKNAEAHLNLGIAYRGLGQYDKALAEYDIAEKLNPELAGIYLARGVVLHKGKNAPERGLELYKKYISLAQDGVGDSGVYKLIQEAEQSLAQAAELKAAEEEAIRMEKAAKEQERIQKEMEKEAAKNGDTAAAAEKSPEKEKGKDEKPVAKVSPAEKKAAPPPPTPPVKNNPPKEETSSEGEPLDNL